MELTFYLRHYVGDSKLLKELPCFSLSVCQAFLESYPIVYLRIAQMTTVAVDGCFSKNGCTFPRLNYLWKEDWFFSHTALRNKG